MYVCCEEIEESRSNDWCYTVIEESFHVIKAYYGIMRVSYDVI